MEVCQVILCFGDFRKALWYIRFQAKTDILSDHHVFFFMEIKGKKKSHEVGWKIMGAHKCQHQVSPRWQMGFLLPIMLSACRAELNVLISNTAPWAEWSYSGMWGPSPSHDDSATVIIRQFGENKRVTENGFNFAEYICGRLYLQITEIPLKKNAYLNLKKTNIKILLRHERIN